MNNCGKRFRGEAAKFRFLNELIKVLSPKYFGSWTAQTVKDRLTQVLYGWTQWLKEETKIQDAYSMLKKQGVIKKDPKLPDKVIMAPPPQRATDSVFDQEDKATLLARLLKSRRPEDLETANRLIKSTMKEEEEKAEKATKRETTLKAVESSTKQLREMLDEHTEAPLQPTDELKDLYKSCERLRPSLFRLASDTVDDDEALTQILAANDELTLAVNAYKERTGGRECNRRSKSEEAVTPKNKIPTRTQEIKSYHLIDLSALDSPQTDRKADSPLSFASSSPVFSSFRESTCNSAALQSTPQSELLLLSPKSYCDELMQLNGAVDPTNEQRGPLLRARGCGDNGSSSSNENNIWSQDQQFTSSGSDSSPPHPPAPSEDGSCPQHVLKNIFVPMETIKSSQLKPITIYDQGGIRISLHFTRDSPPGHPDVAVVVISAVNTSSLDVKHFVFQAAVPKTMSVKLQPSSTTHLPPYNPLQPPPAIAQVILLANPHKCKMRLRYKLTLTHGRQQLNDIGEIQNLPDWTSVIGC
ncbi:ADP-ribosylation factor-binding protein GGA3-like isoform X2 [Hippocampus comes]|nr:PREDICTED: ADP-ribosylation factor-binding protein GGA3-like isoform X2 [Hippocampus comes]XP_019717452.1 PREDICTED: ADP-ribosylation factor-binding protein GGA3-like isoform X2 [Hippocampus comes]XP_019717453.1 PREDICTED: ADP-ribosylation factor-binding protein GGA3-like isoform X2 [Hippocampus comes]XP_019717454.1 PREDICTED: ADP-ribosylation factor-binding protein GGA3-like isoform X2 [Hippocampus comes]